MPLPRGRAAAAACEQVRCQGPQRPERTEPKGGLLLSLGRACGTNHAHPFSEREEEKEDGQVCMVLAVLSDPLLGACGGADVEARCEPTRQGDPPHQRDQKVPHSQSPRQVQGCRGARRCQAACREGGGDQSPRQVQGAQAGICSGQRCPDAPRSSLSTQALQAAAAAAAAVAALLEALCAGPSPQRGPLPRLLPQEPGSLLPGAGHHARGQLDLHLLWPQRHQGPQAPLPPLRRLQLWHLLLRQADDAAVELSAI